MKKYFLTGITGFAAPHLAKILLNKGHEVSALTRASNGREYDLLEVLSANEINSIEFKYGDLRDRDSIFRIFKENSYDGVFHLAAQSHPPTSFKDPIGTYETNILGTAYLIDAIQRTQNDCILQFTSTSEVYGNQGKNNQLLEETTAFLPSNPYGNSKTSSDIMMQERCENGFLRGFITRAFSHTGPRRGKNFSISWDAYHLAMLKKGIDFKKEIKPVNPKNFSENKLMLPVGNLKTKRIVIDVRDCMNAYLGLMENFDEEINGEAYNVCGAIEEVKEMNFFTDSLIKISELENIVKIEDKRVFRPIDIDVQIGSTEKIRKKINWKPEIPLQKTLEDLFLYWEKKIAS